MKKAATSVELQEAFEHTLNKRRSTYHRLEEVFSLIR